MPEPDVVFLCFLFSSLHHELINFDFSYLYTSFNNKQQQHIMSIGFFSLSPDSGGFKGGGRKGRNRRMRCGGGRRTGRWSHPSGGVDDGGGAGGGSRKASFVARIPLRRGLCIALVVLTSGILLSGLPVAGDGVLVGEGSPMIVSTWYPSYVCFQLDFVVWLKPHSRTLKHSVIDPPTQHTTFPNPTS